MEIVFSARQRGWWCRNHKTSQTKRFVDLLKIFYTKLIRGLPHFTLHKQLILPILKKTLKSLSLQRKKLIWSAGPFFYIAATKELCASIQILKGIFIIFIERCGSYRHSSLYAPIAPSPPLHRFHTRSFQLYTLPIYLTLHISDIAPINHIQIKISIDYHIFLGGTVSYYIFIYLP